MWKQRTPKEQYGITLVEYITDPNLRIKLKRPFQQITLYCQSCLTMIIPTLWYVQAST
jgi:hypothetical protein